MTTNTELVKTKEILDILRNTYEKSRQNAVTTAECMFVLGMCYAHIEEQHRRMSANSEIMETRSNANSEG